MTPSKAEIEEQVPAEFTAVRRRPLYLQVAEQIREAIASGRFLPGESLPPERELSEAFGASRASVREALRALQAQGVIVVGGAPSRAVVSDELDRPAREALSHLLRLNRVELADLVDLRCLVETAAVTAAADRGEPDRLAEAHGALETMEDPKISLEDFDEADIRFHVALVRASGNEAMHLVMLALREPVEQALLDKLQADPRPRATLKRLVAEHRAILEALEEGDPDRASGLLERHIRGFYRQPGSG
jgi:DNA-binding FadR family transcriptional regulator